MDKSACHIAGKVCGQLGGTAQSLLATLPMRAGMMNLVFLRWMRGVCAALGILTCVEWASACPNCAVGQRARSLFWADGFVANVLVVLVPFLVIAVVSVRADSIGRSSPARSARTPAGDEEKLP